MIKLTCRVFLFLAILVVFPTTVAFAQNTHSVWSRRPLYVTDGELGKSFKSFVKGNAAAAWTQGTTRAYFRAVAIITVTLRYDFEVVKVTSTNADMIEGLYDIKRNGVLVCDDCGVRRTS
ncbi:MAG TPA: hypothetical protein VFH31_10615 [Pyrinomonadaceae bacterium]|nr:hypothetical protein [Pyrinomonadaceae bacterium]